MSEQETIPLGDKRSRGADIRLGNLEIAATCVALAFYISFISDGKMQLAGRRALAKHRGLVLESLEQEQKRLAKRGRKR